MLIAHDTRIDNPRLGGCRHAAVQDDVMPSHQRRTGRAKPDDGIGNFAHFAARTIGCCSAVHFYIASCPPIIPASRSVMSSTGHTTLIRSPDLA